MGKVHPAVAFLLQAGAAATALIAIGALIERYWSPMKRWLQDALTNPVLKKMDEIDTNLRSRDDKLAQDISDLQQSFDEHRELFAQHRIYVGGHLGPDAGPTCPPLHERVGHLEAQVEELGGDRST